MNIILIAAMTTAYAIGYRNTIPWHLPDDLQRFKKLTTGHAIVMGRKTFESLPHGALPERRNLVLSRTKMQLPDATVCESIDDVIEHCKGETDIYIVGGSEIYRQFIPLADKLLITLVKNKIEKADAWFPAIDPLQWKMTDKDEHEDYTFLTYERR